MSLQSFKGLDMIGLVSLLVVATVICISVYFIYCDTTKESFNLGNQKERLDVSTPKPINTEAPYSNAPVKGQAKGIVVPKPASGAEEERSSMFTLSTESVVRWDLIPMSSKIITFGVCIANPPPTDNDEALKPIVASMPASAGVYLGYMANKLKLGVGKKKNIEYIRSNAYWNRSVEIIEVKLTQTAANTTRVEVMYNGQDKVIASEQYIPVSDIRTWPQKMKVFNTDQVQNIWVTYGS